MKAADEGTEAEVDPRMTAIVERMFYRCACAPSPCPLRRLTGIRKGRQSIMGSTHAASSRIPGSERVHAMLIVRPA